MLITVANILCLCCFGQEKNMISFEAGSFIRNRKVSLTFSRAVSDRWCIEFSSAYRIREQPGNTEKMAHENDLGHIRDTVSRADNHGLTEKMISLQFWPKGNYTGIHLKLGISHSEKNGTSFPLSIGYMFRIWSGLRGCIGYRADIVNTLRYDYRSYNHLTIALGYSF